MGKDKYSYAYHAKRKKRKEIKKRYLAEVKHAGWLFDSNVSSILYRNRINYLINDVQELRFRKKNFFWYKQQIKLIKQYRLAWEQQQTSQKSNT